jgi:hypothetical protein
MASSRSQNRRRRVVFEEAVQNAAKNPAGSAALEPRRPARKRKYSSQARQGRNLTDFIPKHWSSVAAIVLFLLVSLALLNLLDWLTTLPQFPAASHTLQVLSMDSPTGLVHWFHAVCFGGLAAGCWLVYGLRQHRRDDYRGTYRVWSLFAVVALAASVDSVVDLERVLSELAHLGLRQSWLAPESAGVALIRLMFVGLVATRVLIEIRHSKLAVFFGSLAILAASLEVWLRLPAGRESLVAGLPNGAVNLWAAFAVTSLLTVVSFARFVYLDVFGMRSGLGAGSRARQRSKKAAKARGVESRAAGTAAPDSSHSSKVAPAAAGSSKPASAPARVPPLASRLNLGGRAISTETVTVSATGYESTTRAPSPASESNDADRTASARLSKSERKRLKKQQRHARRAA